MGIIQKVKEWPIAVAFAAGLTVGGGATYELTLTEYDPNAKMVDVADSLHVDAQKKPKFVDRPYFSFDTTGAGVWQKGDVARMLVYKNDKVILEAKREITEAPLPPNDAIASTFSMYFHEDRVASLDTANIGE